MVFLQEVALDDNHNRIGDVLRVRRKEKRYIESVNPPLDPLDTIRLTCELDEYPLIRGIISVTI